MEENETETVVMIPRREYINKIASQLAQIKTGEEKVALLKKAVENKSKESKEAKKQAMEDMIDYQKSRTIIGECSGVYGVEEDYSDGTSRSFTNEEYAKVIKKRNEIKLMLRGKKEDDPEQKEKKSIARKEFNERFLREFKESREKEKEKLKNPLTS